MRRLLLVIALMAAFPAFADTEPSTASIRELMVVTDARKLLDSTYAQVEGLLGEAMKPALGDLPPTPEQQALIAEFQHAVVELMRKEMSWEKLEPAYIDLYARTFSQTEIDGMLAFYKSESGRAVLAKMPQLIANTLQMTTSQMQSFMPGLQKLAAEYVEKVRAARKQQ